MKAVILCAKKEESLYPFTESKPTALIPIAGKPLIKHIIKDLQKLEINDIYIVTNYMEEKFVKEFEEYTNVNTVTQEELAGTGDAVKTCSFIKEDFIVMNGDVITSKQDIESLINKHQENNSKATILATERKKPNKFGVLSITNDKVNSIEEKPEEPENPLINTGIYIFKPEIFKILQKNNKEENDLTKAVSKLVENNEVRFELVKNYWLDIGTVKKLHKADSIKRENLIKETNIDEGAKIHEKTEILGETVIEEGVELKPGTVIEGKTYIGKNSEIGPNTTIKNSTINRNSQIRSSDIENSFLFEKNIVDPSTFIEDSIIGEETSIKSNTSIRESFIGPRSYIEINNSIYGVKFVPDARTDLSEISK